MRLKQNGFTVIEIIIVIFIVIIFTGWAVVFTRNFESNGVNSVTTPTSSPKITPTISQIPTDYFLINPSIFLTNSPIPSPTIKLTIKPSLSATVNHPSTLIPTAIHTQPNTPTATLAITPMPTPTITANQSCGSNYTFFDTSPVDISKFNNIVPLGNLNPSGHVFPTDHIYFYQNFFSSTSLVAPGQATITRISASQNLTAQTTDYGIYLKPCSHFEAYFMHVTSITQKLLDAFVAPYSWDNSYSTGGSNYRNYGRNVSIEIESGEVIGTFLGTNNHPSFDLGAYDSRINLNFVNPSARMNSLHTVCPIDYFSNTVKSTLYNYFMSGNGTKRTIEPICGTIDQDVVGTAQGIWLLTGTTQVSNEDPHLALVHDNLNPNYAVFSVGTSVTGSGLNPGVYQFMPSTTDPWNKDFNLVVPEEVYCYQITNPPMSILIQLPSPTILKIAKNSSDVCGLGP